MAYGSLPFVRRRVVFCPRCDAMVTATGSGSSDDPIVLPAHTVTVGGISCLAAPAPARALITGKDVTG
jgi:hypothetical protein